MTHEVPAEDEAFADAEEAPDQVRHQEGHTAYEVTSPVTDTYTEDEGQNEIVSVKEDERISDVYDETRGKPLETLLEEEAGQERLPIMEEQDKDSVEDSPDAAPFPLNSTTSSSEHMTNEEASEILVNLQIELGKKDRHREVIALTMAQNALCSMDDWMI